MASEAVARTLEIPNDWEPRPHQLPLWRFLEGGGKRAVAVWHRRAGKDSLGLNFTASAAFPSEVETPWQRKGLYWHLLPSQRQGRKVVWDGIDAKGRRIIDQVWPPELRASQNATEMKIELINGSIWQVVGSDNFDALVGANPVGVVFSEYSLTNPSAWNFVRPILAENGGWALFIYTPRGRNHGHRLFQQASRSESWFAELLTVDDTQREDGSPVITQAMIDDDRASDMPEELIEQEYYCGFDAALVGSYYGSLMKTARAEGRIDFVPARPDVPVHTAWDIGVGDATAIWFFQQIGQEIGLVDYHEENGKGVDHYAKVVHAKPYTYGTHYGPHDVAAREWGTGKSREEQAKNLGLKFTIVPKLSIEDGINAVRAILPRCRFDTRKCERGVDALSLYRKEWDEKTQLFRDHPLHDWTSNGSDAFRYLAVAIKDVYRSPEPQWPERMTIGQQIAAHLTRNRRNDKRI